jgi:CheY-like chemotaxis protein
MPGFSGWDILQSLKQDRLIESKNIVIFTASSDQKLFKEMKNSGVKEVKVRNTVLVHRRSKETFSLGTLKEIVDKRKREIE